MAAPAQVLRMAHTLLNDTFNAGTAYPEVWVRDLNTFIYTALQVHHHDEAPQHAITGFFLWQNQDGAVPDGYIPDQLDDVWTSLPRKAFQDQQCNLAGSVSVENTQKCKEECFATDGCNAITFGNGNCAMMQCDHTVCPIVEDDAMETFVLKSMDLDKSECYSTQQYESCQDTRVVCKNTVETDQETSLVSAVKQFVDQRGNDILFLEIHGQTVLQRLERALLYLQRFKTADNSTLLIGATTYDWGDVQPEDNGVRFNNLTHRSIDIYDQAMYVIALRDYIELLQMVPRQSFLEYPDPNFWKNLMQSVIKETRDLLWDSESFQFIPHVYLSEGSPFPSDFNETIRYYHGGTAIAALSGMLNKYEVLGCYHRMQKNVREVSDKLQGQVTIGMTIYPPYPSGILSDSMEEWTYQNGGDWSWFGGRMVEALLEHGWYKEVEESIQPMLDRVLKYGGFFEWWSIDGKPQGSSGFRGSAGVLGKVISKIGFAIK